MLGDSKSCGVCTDFKTLTRKMAIETVEECPPDRAVLGRSTWTFLHTMAAYYPSEATDSQQSSMLGFIDGLSQFYPCDECKSHLEYEVVENPPRVKSNLELSDWFCQLHNQVNKRLGKKEFDCSKVFERWRTGTKNSKCFDQE